MHSYVNPAVWPIFSHTFFCLGSKVELSPLVFTESYAVRTVTSHPSRLSLENKVLGLVGLFCSIALASLTFHVFERLAGAIIFVADEDDGS